jgi:AmiR/NasT family two-component response regulator
MGGTMAKVLVIERSVDLKQLVIVFTEDSTPETARQVRTLGVSEFIIKGSSLHLLGDVLKRRLPPLRWRLINE